MPKPLTTPQPSHPSSTPQERGKYLVTLAGCGGCHTITKDGVPTPGMSFAGGQIFEIPGLERPVFTANITPDASGIAHYDESLFINTLRTGQMGGRTLNHIMPFEFFKNMTDDDMRDIFAFVKAQPPVKHRVNNTDPPTLCPLCNQTHGLGELNAKK
jgi:nicotinate dehydrogenase subunit B